MAPRHRPTFPNFYYWASWTTRVMAVAQSARALARLTNKDALCRAADVAVGLARRAADGLPFETRPLRRLQAICQLECRDEYYTLRQISATLTALDCRSSSVSWCVPLYSDIVNVVGCEWFCRDFAYDNAIEATEDQIVAAATTMDLGQFGAALDLLGASTAQISWIVYRVLALTNSKSCASIEATVLSECPVLIYDPNVIQYIDVDRINAGLVRRYWQ